MDVVCRTCLKIQKKFFNIFEHLRNNQLISDMLIEFATIKVQKDDGLSINICYDCFDRLNSAYDFKAMVIESDIKLRNLHCNKEKQEDLQTADSNNDVLLLKEENPFVEVEKFTTLDSKDTPTSVINCYESLNKSDCENFVQSNLPSNNENTGDNNDGHIHQIEKNINKEEEMEQETSLKNTDHQSISIVDKVGNYKVVNQDNSSVQNTEIFLKSNFDDDLLTRSFSNSDCEDDNLMQVESQENADNETSSVDNDNKHAISAQNIKTTLSKAEKDMKTIFCKECNRTFGFRYYFDVHNRLHTGDKPFKCGECGKAFPKQYLLKAHKAVHLDDKPFSCDVCGKAFKFLSGILGHKAVHSEKKPYTCSQCNKTFKRENSLKCHSLRHQSDKSFVCEVCGKAFVDRSALSSHMVAHITEKKIACPKCGKYFQSKCRMKQHFKYHSDERPYACSYCDRRFNNKKVLNNHILIHTGEKPFTCKICNKSFRQSCVLTLHMRSHTGEVPYQCKLCPSKFKYSHQLRKHMKVHNESQEK